MKAKLLIISFVVIEIFCFSCSESSENHGLMQLNPGHLSVDNNKRYFVFEDGTPYIPIGLNNFLLFRESESTIDSLLNLYSEHGINYLRIWVGLGADPETEVGKFDEKQMNSLDYIVKTCNKYGVYLNICFWNENCIRQQEGDWGWNGSRQIYNKNNNPSGTTTNADDLKDTLHAPSWNAMKNRYEYFVERWKNEPAVIMWDLVNDSKKSEAWKQAMYDFVRSKDIFNRIITFQYNTSIDPKGEMDCGSVRVYNYNPAGNDPEAMMTVLAERIKEALEHGDPVYCGEGRMSYEEGTEYDHERGFLHFLWAPVAVGAAGNLHPWLSGNKWPDLSPKELDWMKCYSDFCRTVSWSTFSSRNADEEITTENSDIRVFACRSNDEILFYLMNDDPSNKYEATNAEINLASKLEVGKYSLDWIDIRTGEIIKHDRISAFPATKNTPEFRDGLFGHVYKIKKHK